MVNRKFEAVEDDGNGTVRLTVTYKLNGPNGEEESDTNSFSAHYDGKFDRTVAEAMAEVVDNAHGWVRNFRAENPTWEIGCWDNAGFYYGNL